MQSCRRGTLEPGVGPRLEDGRMSESRSGRRTVAGCPGEKFNQRRVELFRRFFVGEMTDSRVHDEFASCEMPAKLLSGLRVHGWIRASPDQQGGDFCELRNGLLECAQIVGPVAHDGYGVFEASRHRHRRLISLERAGRDALGVAVEAG